MDSQTKTATTAIGVAAALSYFWTPLRDFWYDNFFAPLLADARGVPVNGVTATYNSIEPFPSVSITLPCAIVNSIPYVSSITTVIHSLYGPSSGSS